MLVPSRIHPFNMHTIFCFVFPIYFVFQKQLFQGSTPFCTYTFSTLQRIFVIFTFILSQPYAAAELRAVYFAIQQSTHL